MEKAKSLFFDQISKIKFLERLGKKKKERERKFPESYIILYN